VSVIVVGAGHAGVSVAAALRAAGHDEPVTLVGDEPELPYQRPPLSKAYLKGTADDDAVRLRPASSYAEHGVELRTGDAVAALDRDACRVRLSSGEDLPYQRLVLATGTRPRVLPLLNVDLDGVLALRSLAEARELRARLSAASAVVIVGGGFIGLELAAAAAALGVPATVVEVVNRVMARAVTPVMSEHYARHHREQLGTDLVLGEGVRGLIDRCGAVQGVELTNGHRVEADLVVLGVGVTANDELAAAAGLVVDDGILVDECLRTADPAVFAIGDCARFPSPHAGGLVRLESVQNATDQGRAVAAAITGRSAPYRATPWFWTEQGTAKLQIAGILHGHDELVVRGDPAGRRFSVFAFRGGMLLGAESVNRPVDHMVVRKCLTAGVGLTPEQAADEDFDLKMHAAGAVAAG